MYFVTLTFKQMVTYVFLLLPGSAVHIRPA